MLFWLRPDDVDRLQEEIARHARGDLRVHLERISVGSNNLFGRGLAAKYPLFIIGRCAQISRSMGFVSVLAIGLVA